MKSFFMTSPSKHAKAEEPVQGPGKILADYAGIVREVSPRADGIVHVDTPASIEKLKELHVNTCYYLIWHEKTDWDDLKNEFLPAAKQAGINVVVYLVPPTELTGTLKSYPYATDYIAWAKAIADLSLQYNNVIGWSIDDFNHNLNVFTPNYLSKMKDAAKNVNPNLLFTPQMYTETLDDSFLQTRGAYIDGVVLAFRDGIYRNTQVYTSAQEQIDTVYNLLKNYNLKLYWMVYASQLSRTPANPSADYIKKVIQIALQNMEQGKIEGVITYVLKKNFDPEPGDDQSYNDKGYLNFFLGLGVPTTAGDYTQASQQIKINKSDHYSLSFQTMDSGPNVAGYHKKQLLVDGQVVWEQDTAEIIPDLMWQPVQVDLTPYLAGKKKAEIAFRFYENKGVNNFWTYAGFDALQPFGFTVNNGDFTDTGSWNFTTNYPGIVGEILQYDEQRALNAYQNTMVCYSTYALYTSIYYAEDMDADLKTKLISKVQKILDEFYNDNNKKVVNGLNSLEKEIVSQIGKKIPLDLANSWVTQIQYLRTYFLT